METKKHISFPSIERFANVIKAINHKYNFTGFDEAGDPIYDHTMKKPILNFKGTVKLHGTNFGVCYNALDGMWSQSRENIITVGKDNAGSAAFVESKKEVFQKLFEKVAEKYSINTLNNNISIYGEWAGGSIQKGVAISNIEKAIFIIGVKISPHLKNEDDKTPAYWVEHSFLKSPENRVFNIEDFPTFNITIDFNNPLLSQNKIIEMTLEVEEQCPVGKAFGFEGIGEGIVFSYLNDKGELFMFKSKGEKHAKGSKVTTLKPVDEERLNNIINLVNEVTPDWRLQQAIDKTFDLMNGGTLDIKKMGDFIKNVMADVLKEEVDTIAKSGFEFKELNGKIAERSKQYFFAFQLENA